MKSYLFFPLLFKQLWHFLALLFSAGFVVSVALASGEDTLWEEKARLLQSSPVASTSISTISPTQPSQTHISAQQILEVLGNFSVFLGYKKAVPDEAIAKAANSLGAAAKVLGKKNPEAHHHEAAINTFLRELLAGNVLALRFIGNNTTFFAKGDLEKRLW